MNIGNFVGEFVKSDLTNFKGGWKMYARIRVTLNIDKPLRRRMKIKWEGADWSWVNFKYERLSTFCFVCGTLGHSERDCNLVYANLEKDIVRAYGAWLRAPTKNTQSQNLGTKWLRKSGEGSKLWEGSGMQMGQTTTVQGRDQAEAQSMEVERNISDNVGENGGIRVVARNQEDGIGATNFSNQMTENLGGNPVDEVTDVIDPKRRQVDDVSNIGDNLEDNSDGPIPKNGPKNL